MYINKNTLILLVIVGLSVFATAFYLGQFFLKIGTLPTLAMAAVLSLGSDILVVIGNDRLNKSKDAKLHQRNELAGEYGKVITRFKQHENYYVGRIEVRSENWSAKTSDDALREGDEVYIKDREGLVLIVENKYNHTC